MRSLGRSPERQEEQGVRRQRPAVPTAARHAPLSPASLLSLQRSAGNTAVAQLVREGDQAGPAVTVQRAVKVTPDGYARAHGHGSAAELTPDQLKEYLRTAVWDDYQMAVGYADDGGTALKAAAKRALRGNTVDQARIDALTELIGLIDAALASAPAHKDTRYHVDPKGGYQHTDLTTPRVAWASDTDMWDKVGPGLGEVAPDAPVTTGRSGSEPLKQLTWDQAKRLLPRPLLNLLFDVRLQLESGTVIDERTRRQQGYDDENNTRITPDTTPNEPGTLRSWHQDDLGRLPGTQVPHGNDAAAFADQVPAHGRPLHDHYAAHSGAGTGSAIQQGANFPRGFAEYTGTGSNSEHNTKVVLDYINKRVYLTLTHYQFWGAAAVGGRTYFLPSGTQARGQVEAGLLEECRRQRFPGRTSDITVMNPWLEILMP
ncbi:hypothetical protein [Streptomyces sclerotialus]|uniref:hypothetical protein n=1 Tax=Streptomyces sclerotialus TaxID=1957 RepID=UPI0018C97634